MAEIHLCSQSVRGTGGPSVESFSVRIGKKAWPGGGTVDVAILQVGHDEVRIWPVPEAIRRMATDATLKPEHVEQWLWESILARIASNWGKGETRPNVFDVAAGMCGWLPLTVNETMTVDGYRVTRVGQWNADGKRPPESIRATAVRVKKLLDGVGPGEDWGGIGDLADFVLGAVKAGGVAAPEPIHDLYKTGDPDAPASIKDENGAVALSLCRLCGRGESELVEACGPIVFEKWTCTFPGKNGISWKRAWDGEGTKAEAEAQAARNCNVVAVPVALFETMKENERRMVAAEQILRDLRGTNAK